jgi:hypothetical protein
MSEITSRIATALADVDSEEFDAEARDILQNIANDTSRYTEISGAGGIGLLANLCTIVYQNEQRIGFEAARTASSILAAISTSQEELDLKRTVLPERGATYTVDNSGVVVDVTNS